MSQSAEVPTKPLTTPLELLLPYGSRPTGRLAPLARRKRPRLLLCADSHQLDLFTDGPMSGRMSCSKVPKSAVQEKGEELSMTATEVLAELFS